LPHDLPVEADPLQLRLDFHRECVVMHDYTERAVRARLVSALDVARALARDLDVDTGLLPPDALWWVNTSSGSRMAIWRDARVWTVRLRQEYGARPRRFRIPMPGLIFVCQPGRQAPYVFAATARPRKLEETLYHCPTYNVFNSGRVCPGTHAFPADPARVPEEFFASFFSPTGDARGRSRRHPEDVGQLWPELHRQQRYPLDDLVPALRVADAMRIGS
jgi:Prokaryotic E2 family D